MIRYTNLNMYKKYIAFVRFERENRMEKGKGIEVECSILRLKSSDDFPFATETSFLQQESVIIVFAPRDADRDVLGG